MRRSRCWSVGVYVVAGACLAATIMATSGCDEKASKKGELSETEIKRLTLAQKPERPDQVIVCGETITWEDVLSAMPEDTGGSLKDRLDKAAQDMLPRQFMEDERPAVQQRLNNKISSIVLAKRAERDLGKKEKFDEKLNDLAETELRRFIYDEHGGNGAEADEALHKLGMNRTTYKQWKKKELLARYLVESKYSRNRPITYSELQERYEEMKKAGKFALEALLQWRLIDVSVDKMGAKYPNEDASLKARQLAEDLRRRIDAGADFAELAKKYSDGPRSEEGGLWPARDPNALATPYDVLAKRAQEVAQGQVAGPIESSGHFFLMRIEKKQQRSYVPLNDVQDEVRKDILDGRWNEVFNEMDAEVRRQVDLAHTDRFVDFCLERFYQQAHAKDKDKG